MFGLALVRVFIFIFFILLIIKWLVKQLQLTIMQTKHTHLSGEATLPLNDPSASFHLIMPFCVWAQEVKQRKLLSVSGGKW